MSDRDSTSPAPLTLLSVPQAISRPAVIQLVFREKGALYAAYIPSLREGGVFVPTSRDYRLGEDIYLLLTLPDDPQRYPVRSRKLKRSSQSLWMLWVRRPDGAVWLNIRPTPGVWAGLHCFPLFQDEEALRASVPQSSRAALRAGATFMHVLTHKDLHLHPWHLTVGAAAEFSTLGGRWVPADRWPSIGLPAPIRKLLVPDCP